jgi:hypothetical protein
MLLKRRTVRHLSAAIRCVLLKRTFYQSGEKKQSAPPLHPWLRCQAFIHYHSSHRMGQNSHSAMVIDQFFRATNEVLIGFKLCAECRTERIENNLAAVTTTRVTI